MELLLMTIAISVILAIVILFVLPPLIFWIKKHFGMQYLVNTGFCSIKKDVDELFSKINGLI